MKMSLGCKVNKCYEFMRYEPGCHSLRPGHPGNHVVFLSLVISQSPKNIGHIN